MTEQATPNPLAMQVGGDHYKHMAIQPMEFSAKNRLNPMQHTAIKYITRFRSKGGVQDLHKAKHCVDLMGELGVPRHVISLGLLPPAFAITPKAYCERNGLDVWQALAVQLIATARTAEDLPLIQAAIDALIESEEPGQTNALATAALGGPAVRAAIAAHAASDVLGGEGIVRTFRPRQPARLS